MRLSDGITGYLARNRCLIALMALALALVIYDWSPMLWAKWQVIDDHEIVGVIGARERLPPSELLTALGKTELADAGSGQRFRATYVVLRYLGMVVFGKQPALWYLGHMLIAALLALTLVRICLPYAGPILTAGFVVFELQQTYWIDVFARLAAAEVYGVLGLCILALGLAGMYRGDSKMGTATVAIAIGTVIAAGAKESFVVTALVPIGLLVFMRHRLSAGQKAMLVASLAFIALVVVTVVRGVLATGQDFYANDVSLVSRIRLLAPFLVRKDVLLWLAGGVAFIAYARLATTRSRDDADDEKAKLLAIERHGWILLGLLALFASQYAFYSGRWPENALGRYRVPGVVAQHVAMLVALVATFRIVELKATERVWRMAVPIAGALIFFFSVGHKITRNRAEAKAIAANSIAFTGQIDAIARRLASKPSKVVVLNTYEIVDFEPVRSVPLFLRAAGVSNPMTVKLEGYSSATTTDPLALSLVKGLEQLQDRGGSDGLLPLTSVAERKDCYSISFSGPPSPSCPEGLRIWR